ncbi:hypothetical protein SLA2020_274060 [Shorea laevis]
MKVKQFEQGLNPHLRNQMVSLDIRSFTQLVDRASVYEESLRKIVLEIKGRGRSFKVRRQVVRVWSRDLLQEATNTRGQLRITQ